MSSRRGLKKDFKSSLLLILSFIYSILGSFTLEWGDGVCVSSLLVNVNDICLRFDSFFTYWSQHIEETSDVHIWAKL